MVVREVVFEGGFCYMYVCLIVYVEEIVLLDGGKCEIEILDEGLDNLVVT